MKQEYLLRKKFFYVRLAISQLMKGTAARKAIEKFLNASDIQIN